MINLNHQDFKQSMDTLPYQEYQINNKKIIWFYDVDNHNAGELYLNNLFVCDEYYHVLWNMVDVVGYDDVCVGFHFVDDQSFYFNIFIGLGFIIDINTFEMISKIMTK
ncbi:MAG: hypothetical protein RR630_01550 [Coprobacillus sp.]